MSVDSNFTSLQTVSHRAARRVDSRLVIWMIRFYQRHISPRKGFRCAHRVLNGGDSCSEAVLKLIQSRGLLCSWSAVRQRFRECSVAATVLSSQGNDSGQSDPSADVEESTPSDESPQSSNDIPDACKGSASGCQGLNCGLMGAPDAACLGDTGCACADAGGCFAW